MQIECRASYTLRNALVTGLLLLPLCAFAQSIDENSPVYKDAGARWVLTNAMPFAITQPPSKDEMVLQIQRICTRGEKIDAQIRSGLVHFDTSTGSAYSEIFPFQLIDSTCGDKAHRHILGFSWPEGRIYPISFKRDAPFDGWRRGDPIKMLKDETPLGFVDGEEDVRVLTTRRLLTIQGDKVSHEIKLSKPIGGFAFARVSIVRMNDDIYFGNDGGEWGGTLYRFDRTNGKVSLSNEGNPVVRIMPDPAHAGCVLVARALAHIVIADGELMRVCHDSSDTLLAKEPVWSIAGKNPTVIAFSNGVGELEGNTVVKRREYPSFDQSVAGMRYAKLNDVILISSGVTGSVSISGAVPMMAEWQDP